MKVAERKGEVEEMMRTLSLSLEDMVSIRNRLEELHMKSEAKKLETISGKMYNLIWELKEKV